MFNRQNIETLIFYGVKQRRVSRAKPFQLLKYESFERQYTVSVYTVSKLQANQYTAVIIDFGKMKEMSKAKIYKLSLKEQERYGKYMESHSCLK